MKIILFITILFIQIQSEKILSTQNYFTKKENVLTNETETCLEKEGCIYVIQQI